MKKFIVCGFTALTSLSSFAQGYQLTLKAPGYKDGITYFTYYMVNNFNVAHSAAVGNNGTAVLGGIGGRGEKE